MKAKQCLLNLGLGSTKKKEKPYCFCICCFLLCSTTVVIESTSSGIAFETTEDFEDDTGEASLDEPSDFTEFIAGGLGAALFFKAAFGGVELLDDSEPEAAAR